MLLQRVKLVLDPTDVIPDKKKKYSQTYEEKIIKKKSETVQRVNPVSKITELMDCWSTENVTISSMYFPGTSGMCYLCSADIEMAELVDCPICYVKGIVIIVIDKFLFFCFYYNCFIIFYSSQTMFSNQ